MSSNWKVLVYMGADNELYGDAEIAFGQLCKASAPDLPIFLQLDGPRAEQASRYECVGGRKRLVWEADDKYPEDRGARLAGFLEWAHSKGKLDQHKCLLILWGHGAGLDRVYLYRNPMISSGAALAAFSSMLVTEGAGSSETALDFTGVEGYPIEEILNSRNANCYLTDIKLGAVLKEFTALTGRKIDLLGLDACLMAMAEICHEIRSSVSILVASDETVPKESWPYDLILGDLNRHPGMDSRTLSTIAVSRYYERYATELRESRIELSSLDLAVCDKLASAVKELVAGLRKTLKEPAERGKVLRARDVAQNPDEPAYVDLKTFCTELAESFGPSSSVCKASEGVIHVLSTESYVIYHRNSDDKGDDSSCGVCIYFPEKTGPHSPELAKLNDTVGLTVHFPLHKLGSRKFPPNNRRFPPNSRHGVPTIIRNAILWNNYEALEFSKDTGWADFVEGFWKLTKRPPADDSAIPSDQT